MDPALPSVLPDCVGPQAEISAQSAEEGGPSLGWVLAELKVLKAISECRELTAWE